MSMQDRTSSSDRRPMFGPRRRRGPMGHGGPMAMMKGDKPRDFKGAMVKLIQYLGNEIGGEIEEKIIKQIVDANFNVKKYPTFIFQDYGEFEAFEITDAIKELFNAGILDLDQEDVNFARSILGLQIRDEDHEDEIRRADPSMLPMAPGGNDQANSGGAQHGNDRAEKGVSTRKTDSRTGRTRPSRRDGN